MRKSNNFFGILLVLIGVWLFLQNAGILTINAVIIPFLFGLAFLAAYFLGQPWALIPGSLFSCIGIVVYLTSTGILNPDHYWPLFIFAPSIAFFMVRLLGGAEFKWAIYPGVFIAIAGTIAVLSTMETLASKLWHYLSLAGPIALLVLGLMLIFNKKPPQNPPQNRQDTDIKPQNPYNPQK